MLEPQVNGQARKSGDARESGIVTTMRRRPYRKAETYAGVLTITC
jgi:hypothetical protein